MTRGSGPDVCCKCRKFKLPHLGDYKPGFKYNTWTFTCHECTRKAKVSRLNRPNNETPPEREVRLWLQNSGIKAQAEYKVGQFIYDFCVPELSLLIELDSRRYHTSKRHRIRDQFKSKKAVQSGWKLVRVKIGSSVVFDVEKAIMQRRSEVLDF